eukprot:gnl/TRDRNA2_/TRDRNA2_118845_c0_seq2.p1 gnl/TRDRNA2_/TRDRNA2_118845_c0~~gnl/TRDRNA2_/TRDRNA2_118845_c0_seq2.p1  ORF type:complete len:118 (+),score=27.84 gnl/TRDRNA2_/TRDRNA2_118845_c0_seq2:230-583(+)
MLRQDSDEALRHAVTWANSESGDRRAYAVIAQALSLFSFAARFAEPDLGFAFQEAAAAFLDKARQPGPSAGDGFRQYYEFLLRAMRGEVIPSKEDSGVAMVAFERELARELAMSATR